MISACLVKPLSSRLFLNPQPILRPTSGKESGGTDAAGMLLASSSSVRLALVGATMFSLIAASDSSQSSDGSGSGSPAEKRDRFDNSLQVNG